MGGGYAIFEVSVPNRWVGKTIGDLKIRQEYQINILATRTDGQMDMNIRAETVLTDTQTLLVLGKSREIQKCFKI